jgi:ABC-type transport system involved in multi-copper enzyme maturation permease subunit
MSVSEIREARLNRTGLILLIGAAVYGALALLVALLGMIGGVNGSPETAATVRALLLNGYSGADDIGLILLILLALISGGALLVVMVGVLAQEPWALLLSGALAVAAVILLVTLGYTPAVVALVTLAVALYPVLRDLRTLRANPVARKELRERMRGARAFAVISVYLALMSAFAVLLFLVNIPANPAFAMSVTGNLGRNLFAGLVGLQLLLIIFIAPAFTSGAITGERERKTYDLLQITLLSHPSFIIGKLESALGYIFLLLLAAIPLQSIAFLFGGVTEVELLLSFVILTVTAVTLGTVGLFFSTLVDRTIAASVRAYSLALGVLVGVPILGGFAINFFNNAASGAGTGFNGSPLVEGALIYLGALLTSLNPITTALSAQELLLEQQSAGFLYATLSSTGGTVPVASPWISFTVIYLLAAVILIIISVRRVRSTDL